MKKVILSLVTVALLAGCFGPKRDIRVACVGDSITEGMGISWQSSNAYPVQLDSILGEGFEVMNFGRSATTMMYTGDFPYWSAKEFTNAFRFHPDIIVIKLGTNDAKLFQWNEEKFVSSYQQMIDSFLTIRPMPVIKVCLPVPVVEDKWEITDSVVTYGVIPEVRKVATDNNLEVIDLNAVMSKHKDLYVDGVHPTREGARYIAEEVARHIR